MNDYTTHFASTALGAERRLHQVLDKIESRLATGATLDAVEEAYLEAAADGEITDGERQRLEAMLREAGLNGAADRLGSLGREKRLAGAVDDIINGALKKARRQVGEGEFEDRMAMQVELNEMTQNWANASNASRMEHQAQMNIIANLKA